MKCSWALSRRTFLRGAGVAVGLPLLDAMSHPGVAADQQNVPPPRLACVYVPNGVNIRKWVPDDEGSNYTLSPTLQTLAEFRDDFSVLSQLSHPKTKGGHSGGDTFLTGQDLGGTPGFDYKNSISVDQLIAEKTGLVTRFPSIEISATGGTGNPGHTQTLAFNREGIPMPAERRPRAVFERLFVADFGNARAARKKQIAENKSILDVVIAEANSLNRKLGASDQRKLDEYLTSVREIERRVERSEQWLDIPYPQVSGSNMPLDADPSDHIGSHVYYQIMFDLMYLAFQTDTTRVATFQMAREAHGGWLSNLGLTQSSNHHDLSHHGGDADMLEGLFRIDKYYLTQFAHFLGRLKSQSEGDGTLLDRTMIVYGSGMNSGEGGGHSAQNLPILFAGGKSLGFKLGQHLAYKDGVPLSNLFTILLDRFGIHQQFQDSKGPLEGLAT
ncbi:MAG: DUF1552 domain-containing protein [Planctomycetales bacterium]|nr:DUF1552 domain-containing protein [Planctomycetales bacterium]